MSKRRPPEIPTLASYWMAPDRDGGVGEPVACLASTYTFHASLFENELVPRFLGLRYDNTEREAVFVLEREDRLATVSAAVFVDSTQVDGGQTTGRWLQVPVTVPRGCQHAKVTLLVWEKLVRVVVASANLTTSGYRKNREVASVLDFFDAEQSTPREVLGDIFDFFDELLVFGRMPVETKAHLAATLEAARRRARAWRGMPHGGDRLPTVTFVPVLPARTGRRSRDLMTSISQTWGNRRASDITVMTPFIGDSPQAVRTSVRALLEIPRTRGARGHLAIGGRPSTGDQDRTIVDLPGWFRDEWAAAWKAEPSGLSVYAVPPHRDGEPKAQRPLHAKGILVQSEDRSLLVMGSSNFSPHGLGEGAFNIEGNLCFVARESDHVRALENALPVDWKEDAVVDAIWPHDAPEPTEDGPMTAPPIPAVFAWATYHERLRKLTIGLDRGADFPARWSIRLPGDEPPILGGPPAPEGERVELTLAIAQGVRRVTGVAIAWADKEGMEREGILPTLVANEDELLAPEELRALTTEGIFDCLLSGRDPIEWAESRKNREASNTTDAFDSLKVIDTSTYTLYRTRRLGRALAVLSRRLLSTLRTPTAMRHRLERDAVGPLMLAQAMVRETTGRDGAAQLATEFGLAELSLCVAHVARRIDPKGKLNLLPLFQRCLAAVEALREETGGGPSTTSALASYVRDVRAKCDELLNSSKPETIDAG